MKQQIERVVLPLEAVSDIATAIDTAARLAGNWQVPLYAVFIQDEDVWHLAGLPFARQFSVGGGPEALTREHVEAHFRAFAERTREAVAAAAARHRAEWSFATVHGTLAAAELGAHDFIVASALTRPIGRYFRLPRRSRRPPGSPRSLLRARRDWRSGGGSVLALLNRRDPAAARLIEIAASLAILGGGKLTVLASPDPLGPAGLAAWVAEILAGQSLALSTEMAPLDAADLRRRVVALDCHLVAIADDHAGFEACFAECDILTVGTPPA
jgi:hypothetical protein